MISRLLLHALTATGPGERITIDDIESRFRDLGGSTSASVQRARTPIIGGGLAGVILLMLLLYLLGKRQGRKRASVLEIRRIV
jgi:hypothetical protein